MNIVILSRLVGYCLFFCSCVFSVQLMKQFAVSGLDTFVWALLGIGFMSAEFVAAVVGIRFILHKRFGFAVIFIGLYVALYAVSLFGTLGFESASSHDARKISSSSDDKKIMLQSEIERYDHEIDNLQKRVDDYAKRTIITRGVNPTMAEIEMLRGKRDATYQELKNYKPVGGGADAFWIELAKFFGSENPDETRFLCFFLIASLLDLTGAAMVVLGARTFASFVTVDPDERAYFGDNLPSYFDSVLPNRTEILNHAENAETKDYSFKLDASTNPIRENKKPENEAIIKPEKDIETETPKHRIDDRRKPDTDSFSIPGITPEPAQAAATNTPESCAADRIHGFTGRLNQSPTVQYSTGASYDDDEGDNPPEPENEISLDDIKAYIRTAFQNMNSGGHFISRRYIGEKSGLGQAKADKIHVVLRDKGLVSVRSKKTFPACSEAEMVVKIN